MLWSSTEKMILYQRKICTGGFLSLNINNTHVVGWKQWITNFAKMPVFYPINFGLKFMQLAIASSSYLKKWSVLI